MKLYRNFQTQEELNREYEVEKSVKDIDFYISEFEKASAQARDQLEHQLDLKYGPTREERLDVFPATYFNKKTHPIMVVIHGGYWRMATSREFNFAALGLAAHGITSVIPTYALAPSVSISEIVRQVRAAIAWTWRHAQKLGGDRDNIHVVGQSAGAHLAVVSMLTDWKEVYDLPKDIIKTVLAVSGLYDLRPLPYTSIGPDLQLSGQEVLQLSPMLMDLPATAPPLTMSYGSNEPAEFRRQTDDFLSRWKSEGLDATFFLQPGQDHFSAILELADPHSELTKASCKKCQKQKFVGMNIVKNIVTQKYPRCR